MKFIPLFIEYSEWTLETILDPAISPLDFLQPMSVLGNSQSLLLSKDLLVDHLPHNVTHHLLHYPHPLGSTVHILSETNKNNTENTL